MNCRFTTIDARESSVTCALVITEGFALATLRNDMRWALQLCPGEGSSESS